MVLGSGDNFLAKSDYANAGIVYLAVVQAMFEHFEMMYEEDGEDMHGLVNRCVQGLGNCLTAEDGNAAARENALQALFEIFRLDLDYGGYGLADEVDELILEHADDDEKRIVAGWARTAMQAATGEYDDFRRQSYGSILLDLEADHLDDDTFLENLPRERPLGRLGGSAADAGAVGRGVWPKPVGPETWNCRPWRGYSEHMVMAAGWNRWWPREIETTRINGLTTWLKEQHEERGELAEALVLAKRLLEQHPDLAKYQDIRELSQRLGIWQATRPKWLAEWTAAGQYGLLTDIHLDEGDIDLALKSVRQPSRGFYYGQWMRVAEAAAETRPQAAAELYREQAEKLVEARGRERYQQACTYLTTMRDLYRQMAREPAWIDFMAEFRERHHRLRALQDELNQAGL